MTPPDDEQPEDRLSRTELSQGTQPDDLETLMRPRLTRRARLLRAGALLALLALVAAGLFWRAGGVNTFFATAIPSPTTAPSPPILILSNVSYGTLNVNGHNVAGPPAFFQPRFGQNTLTLVAAPFAPITCDFYWPGFSLAEGNCSYETETPHEVVVAGQRVSVGQDIAITVPGDQLTSAACAQVRQALSDGLAVTHAETKVPVGQYIATGAYRNGIALTQRTTTPLVARLVAKLPAAIGAPCLAFNEGTMWDPSTLPPDSAHHWVTQFDAALDMVFSTPSGHEVSRTHDYIALLTVDLTANALGNWTLSDHSPIDIQMAQSVCDAGGQDIAEAVKYESGTTEVGWGTSSAQGLQGLQGCRLDVNDAGGQLASPASFVWRFGVLLAANNTAHKLLSDVPLAPKDELDAVPAN